MVRRRGEACAFDLIRMRMRTVYFAKNAKLKNKD